MHIMKTKILTLLAIASLFAVACNGKQDPDDPEKENNEKTYKEPLTQSQQKERLQEIGLELLEYGDISKWGDAVVSVSKLAAVMDGDYDTSAFEHLEDAGIFGTNKEIPSTSQTNYGWWCDYRQSSTQEFSDESVIQLSKINGRHILNTSRNAWEYTPASDFSLEAEVDGSKLACTAKFEEYDSMGKLLVNSSYSESGSSWEAYKTGPAMYMNWITDEYGNTYQDAVTRTGKDGATEYHFYNPVTMADLGWMSEQQIYSDFDAFSNSISVPAGKHVFISRSESYIYMPRKVSATFSDGSSKVADMNIDIKYNGTAAGTLDISADKIGIDFGLSASGYTLKSEKVDYLAESAEVAYVFSYGDKDIIKMNVSEKGASIEKSEIDDKYENNYDGFASYQISRGTEYNVKNMPSSVTVEADILGELQISGEADIAKLVEISGKLDENRESEATFKSWVGQAEQCLKIDVFYDNSTERSAYLGLEPVKNDNEWDVVPVIRFADGTSYAVFEVFFNENDFADLILAIQAWEEKVDEFMETVMN